MKLVIRGLNKSYGSKAALQDFHAVFENGIYGIYQSTLRVKDQMAPEKVH